MKDDLVGEKYCMNIELVFKQVEDCLLENMDGEILLYKPSNATTLHLNEPSVIVWELCNGERSVSDIIETVKDAYPEQADQIPSDIVGVIEDLVSRNVLEAV